MNVCKSSLHSSPRASFSPTNDIAERRAEKVRADDRKSVDCHVSATRLLRARQELYA
jgi:hypothetical protein